MKLLLLCLGVCLPRLCFGILGDNLELTSFSRLFYDDNIFMVASDKNQTGTLYFSQTLGVNGTLFYDKLTIRSTPEIRKRYIDNKTFFFGSSLMKLDQEIGPKIKVELENSFNHAEREPSSLSDVNEDVTHFMNKASGRISWQPTYLNKLKFRYENYIKRWSDNLPLGLDLTNGDFSKDSYSLSYERIMGKRFISELIWTSSNLEYNGERGGFLSDNVYAQLSYVPNGYMVIKGSYGYMESESINQSGQIYQTKAPTYSANVTFFTPKGTTLGINMIYDITDSAAGYWNAKENLKTTIIAKYPITPKTEISVMGLFMETDYLSEYNRYENVDLSRREEVLVTSITLSWRYNKNHYAEIGYQGMHLFNKDADVFRNKAFIGYRLKF